MNYKAIIWDLDGTLVDSLPGIVAATNKALEKHGYATRSTAKIRGYIGDGSWMLIRRAITEVSDAVIDEVTESFDDYYTQAWKNGTKIFDSIPELLERCISTGVKLAIHSNKTHNFTTEIVSIIFPSVPFDIVMGKQDHIEKKPSPEGTLLCLKALQCSASETLFIGDSVVDLQTAKAAATPCAAVSWGYHDLSQLQQEGADHFADNPEELENILFN